MSGGVLSSLLVAWSCGVASTGIWAFARSGARPVGKRGHVTRALLVRPCAGDEPGLARALASVVAASRSFDLEVRVAVGSEADGALPVARVACEQLVAAGIRARVVVTGARAPNRKADQIARTLAREVALAPAVIVADSDVDLTGVDLDALVEPLADPRAAAAWAAPVEIEARGLADRASAAVLDASLHSFPLLAALDHQGMVGKLVALRGDALAAVGGFESLVTYLGEDLELARRLHLAGWSTPMAPVVARSLAQGRSATAVVARYARWIAVIRTQRPQLLAAYLGVVAPTPLLVGLWLLAERLEGRSALLGLVVGLVARLGIAAAARVRTGRSCGTLGLVVDALLADVTLLAAFGRALASRRVVWRGVVLRPVQGGALVEETP